MKKLAVTQPYFFPYLGFFQLINITDFTVILDIVQFKKRSWMCRNRILHPDNRKNFNYINIPIKKCSSRTLIKDIEIANHIKWKERILGQITVYKKAPFYKQIRDLLIDCFKIEETNYLKLTVKYIKIICDYLDIKWNYNFLSTLGIELPSINSPGEWSFYISKLLKAEEYINLPRGVYIYDDNLFSSNGIKLIFLNPLLKEYPQGRYKFISHLSIIDVLMWNHKDKVKEMINKDFELLSYSELLHKIKTLKIRL